MTTAEIASSTTARKTQRAQSALLDAPVQSAINLDTDAFVACVRAKDPHQFSVIISRLSSYIYPICKKLLKDKHHAEDAVQEVLLKLWKKGDTYEPTKSALTTFIWQITVNHCRDILRSPNRGRDKIAPQMINDARGIEPIDSERSPLEQLAFRERARIIRDTISALTPAQQDVVNSILNGEPVGKYARRTGKRQNTVSVCFGRAKDTLRLLLPSRLGN